MHSRCAADTTSDLIFDAASDRIADAQIAIASLLHNGCIADRASDLIADAASDRIYRIASAQRLHR